MGSPSTLGNAGRPAHRGKRLPRWASSGPLRNAEGPLPSAGRSSVMPSGPEVTHKVVPGPEHVVRQPFDAFEGQRVGTERDIDEPVPGSAPPTCPVHGDNPGLSFAWRPILL